MSWFKNLKSHKYCQWFLLATGFTVVTVLAFYLASLVNDSEELRSWVLFLGWPGLVLVATVCGLNPIVPVPPATFAPLFTAAGFSPLLIIVCFTIGTTIADSIGFWLGRLGRTYIGKSYSFVTDKIEDLIENHERLVVPIIALYAVFAPFPNELLLIPLALGAFSYKKLIIPLIIGNTFHHTLLVFGYQQVFNWLF